MLPMSYSQWLRTNPDVVDEDCPDCYKNPTVACRRCLGSGWDQINHHCDHCTGTGRIICPTCQGTGSTAEGKYLRRRQRDEELLATYLDHTEPQHA